MLEDSFEPYVEKEVEYLKKKYNLKAIEMKFKIKWKLVEVSFNE